MKLATVQVNGISRAVAVTDHEVIELRDVDGASCSDVATWLRTNGGRNTFDRVLKADGPAYPVERVKLRSPILHSDKIFGVGMNYRSFVAAARRLGMPIPPGRIWFQRSQGCLAATHDDVWMPRGADDFDYEAELAIVIGRTCRHVTVHDAPNVIAGYTIANDMTLRGRIAKSVVFGKSFDTHMPLGPWIVTADEIGDAHSLAIRTWVNGQLRQESSTAEMIAGCAELIAEISAHCTLNPGDLILTGTPSGSGIFQTPPSALAAGDVVKIEIERIGTIENRVIDEPAVA